MPEGIDPRTQLAEALWNDAETGPKMRELFAKKFPQAKSQMPDLLMREQYQKDMATMQAEREKERQERLEERRERDLEKMRNGVINDPVLRVQPGELEPIEKLMVEE